MKNEFGVRLDRNGYAPSIVQQGENCYICARATGKLDRHEPFGGGNRAKSKRLGMWVLLCPYCHTNGAAAAHRCRKVADWLRGKAQAAAMDRYGWDEQKFISNFGGNYRE